MPSKPSQKHAASRSHLPLEILSEIADHMSDDDVLDTPERFKSLGSACLVSRSFHQAFRPKQFRRISIHDPLPPDAPRYKPSMRAFAGLLKEDPAISNYVRKLCLTMDFGLLPTPSRGRGAGKVEYAPSPDALIHGPGVLHSLNHVEQFTWETSFPGLEVPFQAIVEPMKQSLLHILRLPTLRKLECFNIDGISVEDIPPNVTSLALRDAAISRSPSPGGYASLSGSDDTSSGRSSSSSGNTSDTSLSRSTSRSGSASPGPTHQIQTLRLSNIDSYWAKQLSDAMEYHPSTFSAVRDLTTVNVELGVARRAIHCAGVSLRKLHMSFLPLSEHDLVRHFGYLDFSGSNQLENLTLSFGCWLSPPTLDRLLSALAKTLRTLAHSNLATLRIEIQAQRREGVVPLLAPERWKGVNAAFAMGQEDEEREDEDDRAFGSLRTVTLCVSNYEYPTFSEGAKDYSSVDQAVEEATKSLLPALNSCSEEEEKRRFVLETNFADPFIW